VKVAKIESTAQAFARSYPGTVRAAQRVDLAFQVSGPLIKLPVEEGQGVKQGDLLARIDPRDYEVDLRNARGQLSKAKAALELAKKDYDRVVRIRKQDPGAISGAMVDSKLEAVDRAKAEIKSLTASVDAAKLQLSYTYLKAPFSGVIATRHVDNFQEVRAKQPIATLDDISNVEILVDVPESIIARVKGSGSAKAMARFEAAPGKEYPLTLKEYSTRADPKTQTYRIVLTMPRPEDINVLPGMTATVHGTSPTEAEAHLFIIPAIAVFADEAGNSHVWVVDPKENTIQRRKVTTGDLTGTASVQITDGLEAGQMVAVSGVSRLREGMKVKPVEKIEF
jgi:RND family efflux transporter MFP subunit